MVTFLSWAAEPEHDERKLMGAKWLATLSVVLLTVRPWGRGDQGREGRALPGALLRLPSATSLAHGLPARQHAAAGPGLDITLAPQMACCYSFLTLLQSMQLLHPQAKPQPACWLERGRFPSQIPPFNIQTFPLLPWPLPLQTIYYKRWKWSPVKSRRIIVDVLN